jgi:uncharacterized protein YecE (DUF72 family)
VKPVHIGCSGWSYKDWRGRLYPEGLPQSRWLQRYAEVFDTVEVNNTFYRLPTEKAVAQWVERTPEDFSFAVKASRYLTHIKRLRELGPYLQRFYEAIHPITTTAKMGPVLWQFPENFQRDDERLAAALPELPDGLHAFEFRHASWFDDEIYELLREHRVALVIADDPERPFQTHERTAGWTYIRFHRGNRGRNGNYSQSELETWSRRLAAWRAKTEIYAYFNNDWEGYAVENAGYLKRRLSG